VPFDLDRLVARGAPVPLLEDVAADTVTGSGRFDFSRTGMFVYRSGKTSVFGGWPLIWLDSIGKAEALLTPPAPTIPPGFHLTESV